MTSYVVATLCVVTATSGFIIGALTQQHMSYRKIKATMVDNPYVYECRQHIFNALALLGCSKEDSNSTTQTEVTDKTGFNSRRAYENQGSGSGESLFEQFALWSRTKAYRAFLFMTFSSGQEGDQQEEIAHVAGIMKYGFPGMDEIHVYKNYVLSYDRRNRIAHWVCEHVKDDCLLTRDLKTLHKPDIYTIDRTIDPLFSANMRDFRNSSWVGGHLVSPQNYKCDMEKFMEAYKFPSIVPINRGLKNHIWLRLENYVRELALKWGSVYVYTGPLFMPQRITFRNWSIRHHVMGMNTVAVPTHFFKIIIREHYFEDAEPLIEGFVVPNAEVDKEMDLRSFLADVRDIEHFAGLKFFEGRQRDQVDISVHRPSMTDFRIAAD
ncbi:endonuclease G, mitochondrial isoform X1 [Drosophila ficusphila]|uniref:endonuclease G, mitochondrial isoform X1 n=1 Tax=Drosophila ficusphila TaxID=30025 RepID=UPI0007E6C7EC|nr:endonuclease G, mitochondrial isoform X1 [Drosophila ficusphila]